MPVMQGRISERFEAPDEAAGPYFLCGERRTPDGENLRALIDALEAFFGFGDGFNRRDPESFRQWRMQSGAHALPAVFHAQDGRGERAAEAQIGMAVGSFKEAVRLRGRQKVDDGLDPHGYGLLQQLLQFELDFARNLEAVRTR